jgi:ethanolamine transporter EutH
LSLLIRTWARVFKGLGRSFQNVGIFLGLAASIALIGLILAVPLWYFSSKFATGYTVFVLSLVAAGLLALLVSRIIGLSKNPGALRIYANKTILPILKKVAVVVASLGVIYGIVFLASRGQAVLAILAAVVWLLLLGFLKYGKRGKT